jgi:hypothetical protein
LILRGNTCSRDSRKNDGKDNSGHETNLRF